MFSTLMTFFYLDQAVPSTFSWCSIFSWNHLYNFLRGGGGLNVLDKLGLDTLLGRCFLNIVNGFCINMWFFMYARFWLLSLTVCRKLGGPPHLFMYFQMTPLGVSWIDRAPSLILTSPPPSINSDWSFKRSPSKLRVKERNRKIISC